MAQGQEPAEIEENEGEESEEGSEATESPPVDAEEGPTSDDGNPTSDDGNKMPAVDAESEEAESVDFDGQITGQEATDAPETTTSPARSEPQPPSSSTHTHVTTISAAPAEEDSQKPLFQLTLGGYIEGFYSYNFRRPANGVTNLRGFDFRHNTISLANASIYASFESKSGAFGHLALQWGQTPRSYYQAEPNAPSTAFTGTSNADLWQVLQEGYLGYHAPLGLGLDIKAGLMLSPLGYESITVHNNFHWSIANASLALPFYHTGATFRQSLHPTTGITLGVFNGWNSVVDNNKEKSILAAVDFDLPCGTLAQVAYFTGVEAEPDAEDRDWRHLFNLWAVLPRLARLQVAFQADAGFEPRESGTLWWTGAILDIDLELMPWLYLAARGDFFLEDVPSQNGENGREGAIFFPVRTLYGATTTLRAVLENQLALYIEYRYDKASSAAFFDNNTGLATAGDPLPNRNSQHTATIGFTGWYDHNL